MNIETKVKEVLQKVLDIKPEQVKSDTRLDQAFGVDSTEMVEITVGIKKELGISLANNELKKNYSFNEILEVIASKTNTKSCGPSCGCGH